MLQLVFTFNHNTNKKEYEDLVKLLKENGYMLTHDYSRKNELYDFVRTESFVVNK